MMDIAPMRRLRAAMNVANAAVILEDNDGVLVGPAPELAARIAGELGLPLVLKSYPSAGAILAAPSNEWDIAFIACDPARSSRFAFTRPYLKIEATFAVRVGDARSQLDDFDQAGTRVGVAQGAAYQSVLEHNFSAATLVPFDTSTAALAALVADKVDAVAGIREALCRVAANRQSISVAAHTFVEIEQAVAIDRALGDAFIARISEAVEHSLETAPL